MRFIGFLVFGAIAAGTAATCVACNGGGARGGTSGATSGLSALRSGSGLGTGSMFASTGSSGVRQALLSPLANRRLLRQQMQQQLVAQQMSQGEANQQPVLTRAEMAKQTREVRLAERQARAAAIAERREAAKARNLVKSQVTTPENATQLAVSP
jgi:hypothetical protein